MIASTVAVRAEELLKEHQRSIYRRTDRLFAILMGAQWIAAILLAVCVSPLTWTGAMSAIHPHVWAALGVGSLITIFPVALVLTRPGEAVTRHAIAVGQSLWSALLIHLTGGRIETHFHVFGSLAFLAFYRDWRVLLTGTVVVAADHFLRGLYWPESVYGIVIASQWRWLEHAGWVIFEDIVLVKACLRGVGEMREIASRQAETEVSGEKRYEALVNSVEGVVWEAEAATMQFTLVSRHAEAFLGHPVLKWMECTDFWKSVIVDEDRERVAAAFARKTAEGKPFEEEYRVRSAAGRTIWVRNAVTVIAEEGRPALLRGVMFDVTERRKVESMKNDFISTVSHELRTPLTSIRGSLGIIAGGVAGAIPPKARAMLDIACKNSERLVTLVNDILDISKIESGRMMYRMKTLDLSAMAAKTLEATKAYGQSFAVTMELDDHAPGALVVADEDRLMQVITNLLSNAAKFSPRGGTVRVTIDREGGNVRVSVADRGRGMPEEFKSRIFQKFAQADNSDGRQGQGTGLGLSICKPMTEQMGGKISFTSELGVGSTFRVEFPEKIVAAPSATAPAARPTLLICEDDQDIALILRATLDCAGFGADIAGSAREARLMLARRKYVGMTLDLGLPDENGLSLLKSLREKPETRELPVIVVSAYIDEARHSLSGDAFGIIDWIEKPIDEAKLETALQQAVESRKDGRPRILHIEDDADIHEVVKSALENTADVRVAASLEAARNEIRKERFDLLLLDIGLPDGSGLELLPALRGSANANAPVIIFSACQVSQMVARSVAGTLLKSRTSNDELVGKIKSILGNPVVNLSATAR
jgi:PAS domain S-box-containing protein